MRWNALCKLRVLARAERLDPGAHRRIKGLRLVTAYGIAALLGALQNFTHALANGASLGALAAGFALWASVSEARGTRAESSRDLLLLCLAAVLGAASMALLAPLLHWPGPELVLVSGAFLAGYLRRFGITGTGIGSQIFIGQLLAFGAAVVPADLRMLCTAGAIAAIAAIVPRLLSGPAERPAPYFPILSAPDRMRTETVMGLQAAIAALVIVLLNHLFNLVESAWAITACTYVVANSASETLRRIRRRILGTAIGVPLGLACLPLVPHAPILIWILAACAMVIYAVSLPERYDIACGAYAFTLIVTLAITGETALPVLAARFWETLLGGVLGLGVALLLNLWLTQRGARQQRT